MRVNVVNPDAVVQGSGIWDAGWREARAKGMDVPPDQLEEAYRQRTTLKTNVYAGDVAEAISVLRLRAFGQDHGRHSQRGRGLVAAYVR